MCSAVWSERCWRRNWICIWRQPLVSLSMDWQEMQRQNVWDIVL